VTEEGLTSPPTQLRLSGRQFYRSKDPTNSIKVLKEDKNTQKTINAHTCKNTQNPVYTNTRDVSQKGQAGRVLRLEAV